MIIDECTYAYGLIPLLMNGLGVVTIFSGVLIFYALGREMELDIFFTNVYWRSFKVTIWIFTILTYFTGVALVSILEVVSGTIVLWSSIGSILMGSIFRDQCTADASVLPMILLPTGIVGVFASAFTWVYVSFLWHDDALDAMKIFTYATGIICGLLQFVTFGFSLSRISHPDCGDPFMGFSVGMPLFLAILFVTVIIMNCVHRRKNKSVGQHPS
ncbi:hypothetical protein FSP39_006797 [Pinctada imbricata]|uniref:Uncharacterized protein n=1 Tax=Pinctada imbricata TaxID=66713 RepID=A0AA88XLE5_PINIB|nr:hypothetical protein FSP39_006797 [Pinctada imbricata]